MEMASLSEKSVKLPETSSFRQTCYLLSLYSKEKRSFGDLGLGMTCNIEENGVPKIPRLPAAPTMNLFPTTDKPGDVSAPRNLESMNLFPQEAGFASKKVKETPNMVDSSFNMYAVATKMITAQMTIFYAGQVIVFNDFPADKATDIMQLASKVSSQCQSYITTFPFIQAVSHKSSASNLAKNSTIESTSPIPPSLVKNTTERRCSVPSSSSIVPNMCNNIIPECAQSSSRPVTCDLPIARRNSLHRFLEKRKDRIIAKGPYRPSNSMGDQNKSAESKSWLGLAAQSPQ